MHSSTIAEFANGDGAELGTSGKPGKMRSLRSSSALCINFFDYWRNLPLAPLASALRLQGDFAELHFEQKLPTGLRGKRPNLDLVFFPRWGSPVGAECKFCEPYDTHESYGPIDTAYFPGGKSLWSTLDLPSAQNIAENVGHSLRYRHLDAAQLLKHILGLAYTYHGLGTVRLLYVWYDDDSSVAKKHAQEIADFENRLGRDVAFKAITYQAAFATLKKDASVDRDYLGYLSTRYFPGA